MTDRDWIKKLVDTHWPWQIVETMNDLVDRAENAEEQTVRLRERAESLLTILDRDGVMDWHDLDDARHALRDALK